MTILNRVLGALVDGLLYPFRTLPPLVGLLVVSLLTAIVMLAVVKATSDQRQIAAVKRRIQAGLFEIRLFNDDLRAVLRAQAEILRHNLTYLRLTAVPMFWMIVPLTLLVAQLQFHYGYGGLEPGSSALVKVQLADPALAEPPGMALVAPAGLRVETPAVWIPSLREAAWRIAADRPGEYELGVQVGETRASKSLRVSALVARRSPLRVAAGFWNQLLYPSEPPLPDAGAIRSISVTYPERGVGVLGWELHWMIVFFVLSIGFAFALRKRFNVVL